MNQGKLEVVKQEMARLNFDILGNRELKWTGMGEFYSDENPLEEWSTKEFKMQYLDAISKTTE